MALMAFDVEDVELLHVVDVRDDWRELRARAFSVPDALARKYVRSLRRERELFGVIKLIERGELMT